jgi:hypothetical protein
VTVALERGMFRRPPRFVPGSKLELEWLDAAGLMQVTARVEAAGSGRGHVLELELVGEPELLERRRHDRGQVTLEVSAWTLAQATRRLTGTMLDLSPTGALLSLPELALHAATLELQIMLPDGPLHASATVRRRAEPVLVGVEFTGIDPEQRARIAGFLRSG